VKLDGNGRETHLYPGQSYYFIVELGGAATLEMVGIPGGSFMMGAPETEAGRHPDEGPPHRVDVSPFWMGRFEITQKQWVAVMGRFLTEPGFRGDELPVEKVSWDDAQEFLRALNRKLRLHNKGRQYQYRLPSEAEWEYAARAGTTTPFAFGATITSQVVNYNSFYPYASAPRVARELETIEVGSLGAANAFGLFDMHGNVWEWCEDVYHNDYNGAPTDGSAWLNGGDQRDRTMRGGSWNNDGSNCRSSKRAWNELSVRSKNVGFRVVVSASDLRDQSRRE
jgi:formylglycine-generating enzyme required for sulfatase activity